MSKNKLIKMVISVLAVVILIATYAMEYQKVEEAGGRVLFEIKYIDYQEKNLKYEITGYKSKVKIKETPAYCYSDCNDEITEYNYSKENLDKLKAFAKKMKDIYNDNYIISTDLGNYEKDVFSGILLGEKFFEIAIEEYKYKIEYSESDNLSYDIYFKEDESILVKKLEINDGYDITNIETYNINFKSNNMDILNNYISNQAYKQGKDIIYKTSTLYKDEENIIKSITNNDEKYLDNTKNTTNLLYTISYNGLNCQTPTLRLYSDNTYEYFYTFTTDKEPLVPKTGSYNYDISKIIESENKPLDRAIHYTISDSNNNSYIINVTNEELRTFLNSIDVNLSKCLSQQNY